MKNTQNSFLLLYLEFYQNKSNLGIAKLAWLDPFSALLVAAYLATPIDNVIRQSGMNELLDYARITDWIRTRIFSAGADQ